MAVFGDSSIVTLSDKPKDSGIIGTSEADFIFIGANSTDLYIDAGSGDDFIVLDAGDDYIKGGDGDDNILAGNGNNIIYGGAGDDVLSAGGTDIFYGGDGDDSIIASQDDFAYGDAGNDVIKGSATIVNGGAGNDVVEGQTVYDSLGDDVVLKGASIYSSGSGSDIYYQNSYGHSIVSFESDTSGVKFVDTSLVNGYQNVVDFNFNVSEFTAFQDNGHYYVLQTVNATYYLNSIDAIQFNGFSGAIDVELLDNIFPTGFNSELDQSLIDITAQGTSGDDLIVGNFGNDDLSAGAGDDVIYSGKGNDVIDGGDGNDTVAISHYSGNLNSAIRKIDGSVELKILTHTVTLNNVEQVIFLGSGSGNAKDIETIISEKNLDVIPFTVLKPDGSSIEVTPERYSGAVEGVEYQLIGTTNADVLVASSGNDFLNLAEGDDAASGGDGNDILDGGVGSNFLTGGAGEDVFYLDGRSGATTWSTITDFNGDVVNVWGWQEGVSKLLLTENSAGATGFEGITYHFDLNNDESIDTSLTFAGLNDEGVPDFISQQIEDNGYLLFQ